MIKKLMQAAMLGCLSLFVLTSCGGGKEQDNEVIFSKTFIQGVTFLSDFEAEYVAINDTTNVIRVTAQGETKTTGDDFDNFCKGYKDENFNRLLIPGKNIVLSAEIRDIVVTCDRSIGDGKYPAGETLIEIIKMYGASAYKFVHSGYQSNYANYKCEQQTPPALCFGQYGFFPINKLLTEVVFDDMKLMHPQFSFKITEKLAPGEYNFTFSLVTNVGDYSFTCKVNV